MSLSFYNERGEFTSVVTGSPDVINLTKTMTTEPYVEGEWFGKPYYASEGRALPRQDNPAILEGNVLKQVPIPAEVWINGIKYETNESEVELGFDYIGTYEVRVVAWPYLDKEFTIENPA